MPINDGQWETTKHKNLLERMTPEEQEAFRYLYSRFYKDVSNDYDAFATFIVLVKKNEYELNDNELQKYGMTHIALVACATRDYLGSDMTYFQIGWVKCNEDCTVYDIFDVMRYSEAQTETGHYNMIFGQLMNELDYMQKKLFRSERTTLKDDTPNMP